MVEQNSSVMYPNQEMVKALASIGSLVKEAQAILPLLRREFRGEAFRQYSDGDYEYIQVSKPLFVRYNEEYTKPLMTSVTYKDGTKKEVFVPHDEAIEEVLSMIKFMGVNNITFISNVAEDVILDDLLEFECKLAVLLALKQKRWGIDKEMLPMIQTKIKTVVQDARFMARQGTTIKAIQKTVQRIEQYSEGDKKEKRSPYN